MEYAYKPTEYEIKLIILFAIKALKKNADYTLLDFVISSAANVNYFELEPYIAELIAKDNLMEYSADGKTYFAIKEKGEETLEFFTHKIPGSIRIALEETINTINRNEKVGNIFVVDYIPVSGNEYNVKFLMEEGGIPLIDLNLYAGSKERAIEICSYLKNNTSDFYKSLTEIIDKGTKQQ